MNFRQVVDATIKNIEHTDRLMLAAGKLSGPLLAPVAPAVIFGWAFYSQTNTTMQSELSALGGFAIACGLIVAGLVSAHNAIAMRTFGASQAKQNMAWGLVAAYVIIEIGGLWAMRLGAPLEVVGSVATLVALIVYLTRALAVNLEDERRQALQAQAKAEQDEQDEIDFDRRQAEADAEHARQEAAKDAAHRRKQEQVAATRQHKLNEKKQQQAHERAVSKQSVQKVSKQSVQKVPKLDTQTDTLQDTFDELLDIFRQNPAAKKAQVSSQIGVSRSTLYNYLSILEAQGLVTIDKANKTVVVTHHEPHAPHAGHSQNGSDITES